MTRLALAATALLVALTACSSPAITSHEPNAGGGALGGLIAGGAPNLKAIQGALVGFDACEDFLSYVKAEAIDLVGPYGLETYSWPDVLPMRDEAFGAREGAPMSTTLAPVPTTTVATFSTTNNQELGVDEADIVKTDGRRLVMVLDGKLSVVDVTGSVPELMGSVSLSRHVAVSELFLHEDRVVLLGSTWNAIGPLIDTRPPRFIDDPDADFIAPTRFRQSPSVTVTEVDISSEPTVTANLQIDGAYVSARLIDGVAKLVVRSGPTGFDWVWPQGGGLRAERLATEANQQLVADSTIENWVPYFILTDANGDVLSEGAAIECDRARHPVEFAGLNMLSILSLDLAESIAIVDGTGVLGSGNTVYASPNSIYVASQAWRDDSYTTQIHQFSMNGKTTEYTATGGVNGTLLNQFAMSEHNGDLRVATTTVPDWQDSRARQESLVTVLRPSDGELKTIGSVDGLGLDEQIYSVRFLGAMAYVVTFRQIDPLFTIDLSDPTDPTVRGELKIPGYSSYLHPVADGLLLGVGQDATRDGRIIGSQVSLFDVHDPDDPVRIAKLTLGRDASSTVEWDHRAFLQWGELVVLPITQYDWHEEKPQFFTGVVVLDVSAGAIAEKARISHADISTNEAGWNSAILRSVVIDDALYTVSAAGVMKTSLETLAELGFLDI